MSSRRRSCTASQCTMACRRGKRDGMRGGFRLSRARCATVTGVRPKRSSVATRRTITLPCQPFAAEVPPPPPPHPPPPRPPPPLCAPAPITPIMPCMAPIAFLGTSPRRPPPKYHSPCGARLIRPAPRRRAIASRGPRPLRSRRLGIASLRTARRAARPLVRRAPRASPGSASTADRGAPTCRRQR